MKAVIIQEVGRAEVVDAPEPKLRPDYVKVKTVALALNPADWKHIDFAGDVGGLSGCDYSGIVEEVGDKVRKDVKKGDQIFGMVHGANALNHEDGCFAEFCMQKDGIFIKKPSSLSFEEAASLCAGVITVGQSLYQTLELPLPDHPTKDPFPLLIYGGSTATGLVAIQYAKLSGLTVVTTSSPKNFGLLKSFGADAVFDYNQSDCAEQIRSYTNNKLRYVFDCIALDSSVSICAGALSSDGKSDLHYSALLHMPDFPRKEVKNSSTIAFTAMGEELTLGDHKIPVMDGHYEFAVKFCSMSEKLIAEGKIKPPPIEVGKGGLHGVLEGLQRMRENKVSGTKLVYRTADTEGISK